MQGTPTISSWQSPQGPLGRLTAAAGVRASQLLPRLADLRERAYGVSPPSMCAALVASAEVAVIAELKRASPSRGPLNVTMDHAARSGAYVAGGARAISVLTEPQEFGAWPHDLPVVAAAVAVPILQKDFHVGEAQIWEARGRGASAMLFIARALAPGVLEDLVAAAVEIGVEPLVEVRTDDELERALRTNARMIGVNARDLETLEMRVDVTERLLPRIPADRIAIAESGLATRSDVQRVARQGADAVLVGSALSIAADPRTRMAEFVGVTRSGRAA